VSVSAEVLRSFGVTDDIIRVTPIGGGHIHGTWRVQCSSGSDVVAQRINTDVFRDLHAVGENLARLDDHFRARAAAAAVDVIGIATMRRDAAGSVHVPDSSGAVWRVTDYAADTVPARAVRRTPAVAHAAGFAFGAFIAALRTLPGPALRETIPGFHDFDRRVAQFDGHCAADRLGRLRTCRGAVADARRVLEEMAPVVGLADEHRHAVHNDAKIDNLLVSPDGRPRIVVDLDTTMPGSPAVDLGELLRTGCSTGGEDNDPTSIEIDDDALAAIVTGFVEGIGDALDDIDRIALVDSGARMATENAIRFLGDHLDGDRYFAVAAPGQNLARARAQLRIARLLFARRSLVERELQR
jgi:aminoglycoside phosphotransferase (APT) family kinase protein